MVYKEPRLVDVRQLHQPWLSLWFFLTTWTHQIASMGHTIMLSISFCESTSCLPEWFTLSSHEVYILLGILFLFLSCQEISIQWSHFVPGAILPIYGMWRGVSKSPCYCGSSMCIYALLLTLAHDSVCWFKWQYKSVLLCIAFALALTERFRVTPLVALRLCPTTNCLAIQLTGNGDCFGVW